MACFAHLGVKILTIQGFMGQLPKERARDREIDQCWRLRAGAFCHRPEHSAQDLPGSLPGTIKGLRAKTIKSGIFPTFLQRNQMCETDETVDPRVPHCTVRRTRAGQSRLAVAVAPGPCHCNASGKVTMCGERRERGTKGKAGGWSLLFVGREAVLEPTRRVENAGREIGRWGQREGGLVDRREVAGERKRATRGQGEEREREKQGGRVESGRWEGGTRVGDFDKDEGAREGTGLHVWEGGTRG